MTSLSSAAAARALAWSRVMVDACPCELHRAASRRARELDRARSMLSAGQVQELLPLNWGPAAPLGRMGLAVLRGLCCGLCGWRAGSEGLAWHLPNAGC